jgi:hypothetical protein
VTDRPDDFDVPDDVPPDDFDIPDDGPPDDFEVPPDDFDVPDDVPPDDFDVPDDVPPDDWDWDIEPDEVEWDIEPDEVEDWDWDIEPDEVEWDIEPDEVEDWDWDIEPDEVEDWDVPPPPLRTLITRPLFDTLPIDNRVVSPNFDLMSGTWYVAPLWGGDLGEMRRQALAKVPVQQPLLMLPKTGVNANGVWLGGLAMMGNGAHHAELWIGRPQNSVDPEAVQVDVGMMGFSPDWMDPWAFVGMFRQSSSRVLLDGVVWHRFEGAIDGLEGWAYLAVQDASSVPLYVLGPSLTEVKSAGAKVVARQATPEEIDFVLQAENHRKRFANRQVSFDPRPAPLFSSPEGLLCE